MTGDIVQAGAGASLPTIGGASNPAVAAAAEAARARILAAYQVAMMRPRSIDDARQEILRACRRPAFAAQVEYAKPVGGKTMRGPSIRLAEVALTAWRNVHVESQTVYEDDNVRRLLVSIIDLESNNTQSVEVTVPKTVERRNPTGREVVGERLNAQGKKVYTVRATDDELRTATQRAISYAKRNEGLRLIPGDIIAEALDVARQTREDRDARDPDAARKQLVDAFAGVGVKPSHLAAHLGHDLDTVSPAELEHLRTIFAAIRDGETTWAEVTAPPDDNTAATENVQEKVAGLAGRIKEGAKE